MKEEFFNYLVATDEIDDFLGYEPCCPNCANKLIKIDYKLSDSKIDQNVLNDEIFIDKNPIYYCSNCKRSYFDNLIDYIDEDF